MITTRKKGLISLVIPTFNRVKYLNALIESITRQTFVNYEVVIVDDGSTDSTQEMLSGWGSRNGDGAFKKIRFDSNKGEQIARRKGFEQSIGEYVVICDDDVVLQHNYLSKLYFAITQDEKIGFAYCDRIVKRGDSKELTEQSFYKKISGKFSYDRLIKGNFIPFPSIARAEAVSPLSPTIFNTKIKRLQDWYFWLTLSRAGWLGAYVPEALFLMYVLPGGISTRGSEDWYKSVDFVRNEFAEKN